MGNYGRSARISADPGMCAMAYDLLICLQAGRQCRVGCVHGHGRAAGHAGMDAVGEFGRVCSAQAGNLSGPDESGHQAGRDPEDGGGFN